MSHKSIAVVAATQIEAHTLAEHLQQHADLASIARSRGIGISFTASTSNQPWPEQPFDELHWLCTHARMPRPAQDINARAAIVHVHYLTGTQPPRHPGTRTYLWRNTDELARLRIGRFFRAHRTNRDRLGRHPDSGRNGFAERCAA